MTEAQEKKNKNIGLTISIGVHLALVAAFLFMVAWRAPNPPFPEYGIELNFGLEDQGYGEVQSKTPASESETTDPEPMVEDQTEDTSPEEVVETTEQPASQLENPISVTEEKKKVKPASKPEEKPIEKKQPEPVKAERELLATYPADGTKEVDTAKVNHGDNPGTVGDKGSKKGILDAKALYGKQGGGASLEMTGWDWAEGLVIPELPGNDFGRVIFQIQCDSQGEITKISTLERSVNPQTERLLKEMILRNSLVRTSGGKIPEKSAGRVGIIVRSK